MAAGGATEEKVVTPATETPKVETPKVETPKVEAKTETKPEPKPGEKKPEAKAGAKTETADVKVYDLKDDDDEIPDDADLLKLSPRALKSRLTRHSKRELKEHFGTTDLEEIKAKLAKLTEYDEKDKKAKAEAQTKEERLEAEKAEALKAKEIAEEKLAKSRSRRDFEKTDAAVAKLSEDVINPRYYKFARAELATHLLDTYDSKELKALGEDRNKLGKVVKKWLETFIGENPEIAKKAKPADGEALESGTKTESRPSSKEQPNGKTPAPGKANSMTDMEWRDYKKQNGLNF
jgi:ribosomal protein S15P/S13E